MSFLGKVSDKPQAKAGFLILYYTGLRTEELPALEYADIDFKNCTLNVSKSYQHIGGRDMVTPLKMPKSIRTVSIPEFLRDDLKAYTERLYRLHKHDRVFPCTKSFFEREMIRGTKGGEIKRIRLHDIRHSHASMLIEMGIPPWEIADWLGHESAKTTLDTCSHLYPDKDQQLTDRLDQFRLANPEGNTTNA